MRLFRISPHPHSLFSNTPGAVLSRVEMLSKKQNQEGSPRNHVKSSFLLLRLMAQEERESIKLRNIEFNSIIAQE